MWLEVSVGPPSDIQGQKERRFYIECASYADAEWRVRPQLKPGEIIRVMNSFMPGVTFCPVDLKMTWMSPGEKTEGDEQEPSL